MTIFTKGLDKEPKIHPNAINIILRSIYNNEGAEAAIETGLKCTSGLSTEELAKIAKGKAELYRNEKGTTVYKEVTEKGTKTVDGMKNLVNIYDSQYRLREVAEKSGVSIGRLRGWIHNQYDLKDEEKKKLYKNMRDTEIGRKLKL